MTLTENEIRYLMSSAELIRSSLRTDCVLSTAEPTHEPHREIIIKANSKVKTD